jgi:polyhydroxyalkanoate synthesis repressor PhaR
MEQGKPTETVLRKYPNRRIYDPQKNAHVTLEEIADRVKGGERVKIIDHKTGEDLTHVIMGQVLFETLKTRPDYLPLDLILLMIRAQDNLVHGFLHHALPQAFQMYVEQQRRMMSGMNWFSQGFQGMPGMGFPMGSPFGNTPGFGFPPAGTPPSQGKEEPPENLKEELDRLRREVNSLKSDREKDPTVVTPPRRKKVTKS